MILRGRRPDIRRTTQVRGWPTPEDLLRDQQNCVQCNEKKAKGVQVIPYIVDTPASIAEDIVNAEEGLGTVASRGAKKKKDIQQTVPIMNAKNTSGTVYCPLALNDGEVTGKILQQGCTLNIGQEYIHRKYKYAKSMDKRPIAYAPHVKAEG